MKHRTLKPESWKEISRHTLLERYGRGLEEVVFRLPDNREEAYVVKKERPTAAIFALTKDRQVILVGQFRPGPEKVLYELPGGYVDRGEAPTVAARRELQEETGYVGTLKPLLRFNDCAYSSRIRHCFLATSCHLSQSSRHRSSTSEKFSHVALVPLQEWLKSMYKNPPTDIACALAALRELKQ